MEAAPLISIARAAMPVGEAAWVAGAAGARLRAALFRPAGRARGSVVLSGGRTEPIEKYVEVIGELMGRGFAVLAHDWRGQGLSHRLLPDRLAGHATGHGDQVADLRAILDDYQARLPRPWIAMGHSMGGCFTLLALAEGEVARIAGCILSAPMLGIHTGPIPPALARLVARLQCLAGRASRCATTMPHPLEEGFEGNILTHDRERFARHQAQIAACPDLALGAPTWGWLDAAFRAMALLARPDLLRRIGIPVILCAAGRDRVVDNAALRRAAHLLPQGRFIEVPGAYHEILMETDERRAQFWWAFDELAAAIAPHRAR